MSRTTGFTLSLIILAALLAPSPAGYGADNPVELGTISWQRDFDEALALAGEAEKPLLVLFQEVPG